MTFLTACFCGLVFRGYVCPRCGRTTIPSAGGRP